MILLRKLVLLLALLTVATLAAAQNPRAVKPSDILRIASVSDAQISPNGEWVVYTVSAIDGDRSSSSLWLARVGTTQRVMNAQNPNRDLEMPEVRSTLTPLLPSGWSGSGPRWSPDGSMIAFFSTRDSANGIWVVSLRRREPRFVASVESTNFFITYAGESLSWSPDSKRIAYISATNETTAEEGNKDKDPRVIDRIQYKSRTAFSDDKRSHVWIVSIERPEPRQLTTGPFYDHAIAFSPSGNEILFVSNHEPDPDANNNSDIFAVDVGGQVRQITQTKGCEYEPVWSPDGKTIAYTATKRDITTIDSIAEDAHVWITSASGDSRYEVSAEYDRRARSPKWSGDGSTVFFLAGERGHTTICSVKHGGGSVERFSLFALDGEIGAAFNLEASRFRGATRTAIPFQIGSFSVGQRSILNSDGTRQFPLAFTMSTATHPGEVWFGITEEGLVLRLSAHNDGFIRSVRVIKPEEINYRSFDGTQIQGWLMKPLGFRDDRRYPLLLIIHGGPHGMYGWGFNATLQAYVSHGYAVLFINPRGSSGYGQKFSDGTINEWGGGDYRDLMTGVGEVLRRNSWIDQERMGVTGGSYGGFMTNWIITQTPRFKAAVSVASVSNLISFYSTSMYQDLIHAEFGAYPWDNYDLLWQWSPMKFVRQAQTPTLFIHGEQDNEVHITQAEEMYMALKRRGVDSVLVRYPREGHGLREPKHRVDALERTLAWFDKFLK